MTGAKLLVLIGVVFACLALWLLRQGWRQVRRERVRQRLGNVQETQPVRASWGWLERAFLRAGLSVPRDRLTLIVTCWALLLLAAFKFGGWMLCLIMLLVPPLVLRMMLGWRSARRLRRMVSQLPSMLDQVIRSLQTGRTLGDAVVRAIEVAPQPLNSSLARVQRQVQLGGNLGEALEEAAELYDQEELRIFALGVKVNHRYGGSATELLANLIKVIQEREQAARQFSAMTGETRMTAVVLGVLPVAMACYIIAVNPGYLMSMWLEPSGRQMLIIAFAMQVLGCLVMWRMLRRL